MSDILPLIYSHKASYPASRSADVHEQKQMFATAGPVDQSHHARPFISTWATRLVAFEGRKQVSRSARNDPDDPERRAHLRAPPPLPGTPCARRPSIQDEEGERRKGRPRRAPENSLQAAARAWTLEEEPRPLDVRTPISFLPFLTPRPRVSNRSRTSKPAEKEAHDETAGDPRARHGRGVDAAEDTVADIPPAHAYDHSPEPMKSAPRDAAGGVDQDHSASGRGCGRRKTGCQAEDVRARRREAPAAPPPLARLPRTHDVHSEMIT
ncbi:hypothetical protein B0H17DRAFT_1197615 [Mycena rosella]|uniref:Uncharacterized protein n=1 Tax=Mycena rosella TaxID=1033263 RepID=A0AAD7DR73_MYCRO|nr:hypothetical protein B0H17DRAFT_1197615 [Mycena rosella]